MRCVYLLLCLSAVFRVHVAVSVKKLLYVEATVDVKNVSREGLSNIVEDLKKVLCMPGEDCQDKKSYQGTTYRPYYYTSRRPPYPTSPAPTRHPWYTTPYRPYYYTSGRPSNSNFSGYTRNPWYTTTYRPYYPYKTTRNYWNSSTYKPYGSTVYRPYRYTNESDWSVDNNRTHTTSSPLNETWTTDFVDEGEKVPFDCSDLPPYSPSGVYNISAEGGQVEVFCDMETDDGYWTVIQSHNISSQLNMNKSWEEYRDGFGKINEVFWLGNKQISDMTARRQYTLRIDMSNKAGESIFAKYELFNVEPEDKNFQLHVESFSGNAENGLLFHDYGNFSTYDLDNDYGDVSNCPQRFGAGWWYRDCFVVDLNAEHPTWISTSLVTTEMKIRPTYL